MIGPAFMADETLGTRLAYLWRSTRFHAAIHRFRVQRAELNLARVERDLFAAVRDIDRYAIVSAQAGALYRAAEAASAFKRTRRHG